MNLPIAIPLRSSRQLLALLVFAHALAAGAVMPLLLPWTLRLSLLGLLGVSLFRSLQRQRRQPLAVLHLGAQGELEIETKVGARETALLEPGTTLLPGLIVLMLRSGEKRLALPLLHDAMSADHHRQLRLWLKWRAPTTDTVATQTEAVKSSV